MKGTAFCLTVLLAAAGSAVGQTVVTLPVGQAAVAGSYQGGTGVLYPFDAGDFHYQEVHASWKGGGSKILTKVLFRRGWRPDTPTAVGRAASITFQMGAGDLTKFTVTFTTNYTSPPTAVFSKTRLSLPSRVKRPVAWPAPWDITLKFSKKFLYGGKTDVVWELWHEKASARSGTFYYSDRVAWGPGWSGGTIVGKGCTATGQSLPQLLTLGLYNYGPKGAIYNGSRFNFRTSLNVIRNPANKPVTIVLGYQLANVQIPGWCAKIYPNPFFFVTMGTSSNSGSVSYRDLATPYFKWLVGLPVYAQAFAPDAKLPGGISLSDGMRSNVPGDPTPLTWKFTYANNVTLAVGQGPYNTGSVITGY